MNNLDKVKKLLRLSKSENINEATLAMQAAQRLMLKYGIKDQDLDDDKDLVSHLEIDEDNKTVSTKRKTLAATLAKHFRVKIYLDYNNRIRVIGKGSDAEEFIDLLS